MKRESEKEQVQVYLAEQKLQADKAAKSISTNKTIIEFKNPFEKVKFERPSWLNIKGGKASSSSSITITRNSDASQISGEEEKASKRKHNLSGIFFDGSKRILPFFRAPHHRGGIC